MPEKKKPDDIEKFRRQIDKIDDKILDLLAERVSIVRKVGETKNLKNTKKSIIRPGREAEMIRRIAKRKDGNLFPKAAVAQMWRMIISSAINIEENACVSTFARPGDRESFWLAREYFGSFTPMKQNPTIMESVRDVIDGKSTVAVVPMWDEDATVPWWVRATEEKEAPKIFARLPFIQMAPSEKVPLVGMGYVDPEETGEDESIWVIKASAAVAFSSLEELINKAGIEFDVLRDFRSIGYPTMHNYLLQVHSYVDGKNRKITNIVKKANELTAAEQSVSAHWLGSYAVPVFFDESKESEQ